MRKTCLILFTILITGRLAAEPGPNVTYKSGSILVKYREQTNNTRVAGDIGTVIQPLQVTPLFPNAKPSKSDINLATFYEIELGDQVDVLNAVQRLSQIGEIEYAQPNYLYQINKIPNDPDWTKQTHLPQISAPEAWDVTTGDSTVIIGILDTGIDYSHEDLAANIWVNEAEVLDGVDNDGNGYIDDIRGWDFVSNGMGAAIGEDADTPDNDPMDKEGHGTHLSGIVAAVANNNIGGAGLAWNCRLMPLRVGYKNNQGSGYIDSGAVLEAIQYAVNQGASILNASFGGPVDNYALKDVMRYAFDNGVVVVKAAGNENSEIGYVPDKEDFILSVSAVDGNDIKSGYSNYGNWVKVAAPGGNHRPGIYSTLPNNRYGYLSGTSFAAPVVAGVAALVKSRHPEWSAAEVMLHVVDTADNIDAANPKYAGLLGKKGRVNAYSAASKLFASKPEFEINYKSIEDLLLGNGDRRINIGETVNLRLDLKNRWADAENVVATISTNDPSIRIDEASIKLGNVAGVSSSDSIVEMMNEMFQFQVDSTTFPHNLKFELEITADGGFYQLIHFQVAIEARVLLVDDDNGQRNVEDYYFTVLDSVGMPYDVWNRYKQGPVGSRLRDYDIVFWFCENAFPTLDRQDRDDLTSYLRSDKNLFIAGQNIGWDLCAYQSANEAQSMNYYNQYNMSSGQAKRFYENYLRTIYVKDQSAYSLVTGEIDDPIADGLEFAIAQPLLPSQDQSPDVIQPSGAGVPVFNYNNTENAATRYDGDHRLVNFGFGGLETIADTVDRYVVTKRLINYLTQIEVEVFEIQNIEYEDQDIIVKAAVTSEKPLQSVELIWRAIGDPIYTRTEMQCSVDWYEAIIPAQPFGTVLKYGVQATTEGGMYSPISMKQIKIDARPPEVQALLEKQSYISRTPYVTMKAFDQSGLDTTSAQVIFWTDSLDPDSVSMDYLGANQFGAVITGSFNFQDILYYQFSVRDLSPQSVSGLSQVYSMLLGYESFESGLGAWKPQNEGWGLSSFRSRSGEYSIHESGENSGMYPNDSNVSLRLKQGLNLSDLSEATLSLWTMYGFTDFDYGAIEASRDSGRTWITLGEPITGLEVKFYKAEFSLDEFTGPGNENVLLRFHFVSNESGNGPGWFIDDVQILPIRTGIQQSRILNPESFKLYDCYPNPFNMSTTIRYDLPQHTFVTLEIYNVLGQRLITLVREKQKPGRYQTNWNGRDDRGVDQAGGVYFYRLSTDSFEKVKKLTLIK